MSRASVALGLLPLLAATACASEWSRSYNRWQGHQGNTDDPYFKWAHCIDERSHHYLDVEAVPADANVPEGTRSQLFTYVLADCRELMSGSAWQTLSDRQVRRLIDDAWQAFKGVDATIKADRDAETI